MANFTKQKIAFHLIRSKQLSFSELNSRKSVESMAFVEYYIFTKIVFYKFYRFYKILFLVILKMIITKNDILQIL